MAIGLAPAGKTIQLNDRETSVNIQLEGLPGGAAVIDESIPAGARIGSGGKDVRGSIMPQTKYVVEYRMNSRAQWSFWANTAVNARHRRLCLALLNEGRFQVPHPQSRAFARPRDMRG